MIREYLYKKGIIHSYSKFSSSDDPKLLRESLSLGFLVGGIISSIGAFAIKMGNMQLDMTPSMFIVMIFFTLAIYLKISAQQFNIKVKQ